MAAKQLNEYLVLSYRLVVVMLAFTICRIGFYLFNVDFFPNVDGDGFIEILRGGLMFDLCAVLYLNLLYMLLFLIPFHFKFSKWYQVVLKSIYMLTNGVGLAANVSDFIYYRFTLKRTTWSVFEVFKNEENMGTLWFRFLIDYWPALLFWIAMMVLLYFLYGRVAPKPFPIRSKLLYAVCSLVFLALFSGFTVGGIRGGFRHSTRPINMSHAGKFVDAPEEMAIVLNTPFCMIRTIGKTSFEPLHYFPEDKIEEVYTPEYNLSAPDSTFKKMNVVVIILESFNREHSGFLNPQLDNGNYKGYTPFLDSLMQESLTFVNAFANGRKSIDAMPSILASFPALLQPYVTSQYSSNKISGIPGLLAEKGYHTSFFHGAPNGSMGFDAVARLLGFEHYLGMDEFGDNSQYDGYWGIWDEPFFQFFAETLGSFPQPFMSTLFSVTSHHPFQVPEQYEGVFPKGNLPLHQCVGYTDMALKRFFERVSKESWYENTIFVITADHSVPSHFDEYKTNVNGFAIPIVFHAPSLGLKGLDSKLAQQVDIFPTIMHLLGYEGSFISFGSSLIDEGFDDKRFVLNYVNETFQFVMNGWALYFDGKRLIAFYD
ncbi:MAG: LTA synthase family protein, partial [Bacteroidales bacterium]|nr:LTA synthase family protein [Bacteroidales bacterium]